jgi:uncharacterized protein YjbI with pentapeptide repeats
LTWTDYKADPADWYIDSIVDDDGEETGVRTHHPAFSTANLKGCSFRYAKFDYADFREADNILEADFTGALGLETCFFDDDVRERVLAQAKKSAEAES